MSWVSDALRELQCGRVVQVRPQGGSMRGRIDSNQLVTLSPVDPRMLRVEDVVFIRWKGNYILHIVKQIQGNQILIGNNLGKVNGWASFSDVIARVEAVED